MEAAWLAEFYQSFVPRITLLSVFAFTAPLVGVIPFLYSLRSVHEPNPLIRQQNMTGGANAYQEKQ
jgi:hypothetical protein